MGKLDRFRLKTLLYWSLAFVLVHVGAAHADRIVLESLAAQSNAGYDFGQKIINWITYGSDTGTDGEKSLLSVVSLSINTIAMFMLACLTLFNGLNYIIQTANKGVPGGQVISSFWMPLRISVATILMVPLTSGFSTLQYGVTTVAEQGNDHANWLQEKGLDYLYDFGAYRPIALTNGEDIVFSWIASEVCKQYINAYTGSNTITYNTSTVGDVLTGFQTKFQYSYNESESSFRAANSRSEYCGSIAIASPSKGNIPQSTQILDFADAHKGISDAMARGAQSKLIALMNGLQPSVAAIASQIMSDQGALQQMQANGSSSQSAFESAIREARGQATGVASSIGGVITRYNEGRQQIVAQAVNEANSASKTEGDWRTQTIDMGWPALGTIFWQINVNQSEINSLAQLMLATANDPQIDGEWSQDQRLQELAQRVMAAKKAYANTGASFMQTNANANNEPIPSLSAIASAGAEGSDLFDSVKTSVYAGLSWITKRALQRNSPDDLIINIQYIGSAIGTTAEVMYMTKAAMLTGITLSAATVEQAGEVVRSNFFSFILPIGMGAKAIGGAGTVTLKVIEALNMFLLPMVDSILTILIIIGFIAGVVLPTIPLSIWFMGVISWMLFYIECLLISPFWLAAHGTAEREGWGTEHTRQGYMLMIGLYLNPILRVAGFYAIFIALHPLSYLVSWFFDYVNGVLQSGFVFLFMSVGGVCVCIMFAYSAIVRVFGLPSELFERGLRWINGGQEVTGDGHSEEKIRNNFMAFVGKAEGAAVRGPQGMRPERQGNKDNGASKAPEK